jgi:hypothetical protein
LRLEPLWRGALKPGHFTVTFFRQPAFKLSGAVRRAGVSETAIVKAQLACPISDRFFHARLQVWWAKGADRREL